MPHYSYRTIKSSCQGLYKEKGSKFLAFAFPVGTEKDVGQRLSELRKTYYDARHHCYAYVLGAGKEKFRAVDDGEPGHSAGDPILGQIRSKDLTNILIVVVRYFGGVKLGVGGLIQAYKFSAADALGHAEIVEKEVTESFHLDYDYAATAEVMRLVKEFGATIHGQDFNDGCQMLLEVKSQSLKDFKAKAELLKALGIKLEVKIAGK